MTVMVILQQVVPVAEDRCILQVTTASLSSAPNSVLLFSAEQSLKFVYGILKQSMYFLVSLQVWSWVVCLPCGFVSFPFPHERSYAICVYYVVIQVVEILQALNFAKFPQTENKYH